MANYEKYDGRFYSKGRSDQYGYVQYNGIREDVLIGSQSDYDAYLSDDSGGDSFIAYMDGNSGFNQRKEDAYRRAQDRYRAQNPVAPVSKPAPVKQTPKPAPTYTPTPSKVTRPSSAPAPTPAPPAQVAPEPAYKPVIFDQATDLNNSALKIKSNYKRPKASGSSYFKRSPMRREQSDSNLQMRINNQLSI